MRSRGVVALCFLLALSCASEMKRSPQAGSARTDCASGVEYAFSFGSSGRLPGQFRSPSSIDVDPFGNLLIADTGNNRIQKFDYGGRFLAEFGALGSSAGGLNGPTDAVENSLSVYVVDSMNERVVEYDLEGNFLSVCLSGDALSDSRHGFRPRKLAFSGAGYAFLTDAEADAVHVLSSFWEPVSTVGGFGAGEGRFSDPTGLVWWEEAGGVVVCDTGNRRLQKLDSVGNPVGVMQVCFGRSPCEPVDVAAGRRGTLYIADTAGRRVLVVGEGGDIICGLPGSDQPELFFPSAVAVSLKGYLYIVDGGADVVHAYKLDGTTPARSGR